METTLTTLGFTHYTRNGIQMFELCKSGVLVEVFLPKTRMMVYVNDVFIAGLVSVQILKDYLKKIR